MFTRESQPWGERGCRATKHLARVSKSPANPREGRNPVGLSVAAEARRSRLLFVRFPFVQI